MKTHDDVILAHLREDSRMTLTKMSKRTNIPVSTLHERMKSYRKGVVTRHTALIDFAMLGYGARARVLLRVNKEHKKKLRDHLTHSPFMNELYKVNNGFDFMVEFVFKQMKDMEEYLDQLEEMYQIDKPQVFYLVDEVKKEAFLSKPQLLMMRRR